MKSNYLSILLFLVFGGFLFATPVFSSWDNGFTQACIKSVLPNQSNYFEITDGCPGATGNWTVAVQSEQQLGQSCLGPNNQSLPVNSPGSSISFDLNESGRYLSAVLGTDFINYNHPCGPGNFTWYVLMDHLGHGGGPFPKPNVISFQAQVQFSDQTPAGATRAIAGWQGYWDGKSRSIELTFAGHNWGDNFPDNPLVFSYVNDSLYQFVAVDGRALGIEVPTNTAQVLTVRWYDVIDRLIRENFLDKPVSWTNTETAAVFLGHETNNFLATGSAKSILEVSKIYSYSEFQIQKGDVNSDNKIDRLDLDILITDYGESGQFVTDINSDAKVNSLDAAVVLANFGKSL